MLFLIVVLPVVRQTQRFRRLKINEINR